MKNYDIFTILKPYYFFSVLYFVLEYCMYIKPCHTEYADLYLIFK